MNFEERIQTTPPAWLRWFVADATHGIVNREGMAPIGCHYFLDPELACFEITLFISRTEVVGGPRDGNVISTGMQIDINIICAAFDEPPAVHWQSQASCSEDQLGNHVSFEGSARGHKVWLRVLHEAPAEIGPGRLVHVSSGLVEDLW